MTEKKVKKTVTRRKPQLTDEDKILGIEPAVEVVKTVDYENELRLYKVTNLTVANTTPSTFNGTKIEAFIGSLNSKARKELIAGAKEVVTVDRNGNEIYKIEVIK